MANITPTSNQLTTDQENILSSIFELSNVICSSVLNSNDIYSKMVSLVGSAGTGKTFLTVQMIKKFIDAKISCAVTAPTHKAAHVIGEQLSRYNINKTAKTIHSFLAIKPFIDYNTGTETFTADKSAKKMAVDVLIVDESSMISQELFELIVEAIEGNWVKFVIFVGDPNQLLPINGSSNVIFELPIQFKLTQIVRQAKDSYIIKIAEKIKNMIENNDYMPLDQFLQENIFEEIEYFNNLDDFTNDFYSGTNWWNENKILSTHKNKDVDAFNRQIRTHYWIQKGVLNPEVLRQGDSLRFLDSYNVNDTTIYNNGQEIVLDYAIKKYHDKLEIYYWECKSINTPDQQVFRVVDPISQKTFNDKLQGIAKNAKRMPFPNRKEMWKVYYQVKNSYANVQYIYASTIHKLQGSTYETCYINVYDLITNQYMSMDEKYRLVYVAITRASKNIKIFMPGFKKEQAIDTSKLLNDIDDMLDFVF